VHRPSTRLLLALAYSGGVAALLVALTGSLIASVVVGIFVLAGTLMIGGRRTAGDPDAPADPSRRKLLALMGALGVLAVGVGSTAGASLKRLLRPDPKPALDEMAHALGAENVDLVMRQYRPGRSGDLQLLLAPFNSSNYAQESTSLVRNDPRSSHASVWMYLERVPIVVYAPGIVAPTDDEDRVTLADLAPTAAQLMGFDSFRPADGHALPGIPRPAVPPKVIVTFVIDGGGWNVLRHWDDPDDAKTAWPYIKGLMRGGAVYRNAIMGSFPAVTACAHATIGTGVFPRTHGITGHNVRMGGGPVKAWGTPGHADPSFLLAPTLADAWNEQTGDGAWVGELGYQIWHLGMLGRGGHLPLGDKPVAVLWDEDGGGGWIPQNPDLYRLPHEVPGPGVLYAHTQAYRDPNIDDRFNPTGKKAVCCTPPIIQYQGDLIESTFNSEPIGQGPNTSLLYINVKAPDYAGHVYNFLSLREKFALQEVDLQIGRVAQILEDRFAPGEFALIVTADHGQCPTVNLAGGVRLDPIQIQEDLEREFGGSVIDLVQSVVPSEIYLSERGMFDAGVSAADIAAFLRDYRYGDNIGPYVPPEAIDRDRLNRQIFAAVLPTSYLDELSDADLARFGDGSFHVDDVDPGIPPVTW
jgi:hypothetical protein